MPTSNRARRLLLSSTHPRPHLAAAAGAPGAPDGDAYSHPHADADGHPDGHAAAAVMRARR